MCFFRHLLSFLSDKIYLQLMFFKHFRRFINFKNPKTFNEKLQWLKLNNRKSEYTVMVDKYLVKEYVASKIGGEYIIPTLGVWDHVDEIDFSKLPNQFVLKWNHDSGSVIICKDKNHFDVQKAVRKLKTGDGRTGYWYGREWPYKNIQPHIIAEKYIADGKNIDGLTDYKVHCFNGEPRLILVCKNRFSKSGMTENFYDLDWNLLEVHRPGALQLYDEMKKPEELSKMIQLSKELSKNIPFVRIDFYVSTGRLFFGELTFFPASGFLPFAPKEWDEKLGDMLKLDAL